MWSIGNEIDYPNDPYTHEILSTGNNPQIYGRGYDSTHPRASRLGEISKHLVDVAKQYDTTRPITAAPLVWLCRTQPAIPATSIL